MASSRKQGALALVLLSSGVAGGLGGCGPSADDVPQAVSRPQYASLEDCLQDWRTEAECEPQAGAAEPAASGVRSGPRPHLLWWGPYYTRSGTVYHYDGRVTQQSALPTHASAFTNETLSARQMYNQPGRYASGTKGRGGFGGSGRSVSGGG